MQCERLLSEGHFGRSNDSSWPTPAKSVHFHAFLSSTRQAARDKLAVRFWIRSEQEAGVSHRKAGHGDKIPQPQRIQRQSPPRNVSRRTNYSIVHLIEQSDAGTP